MVHKDRRDIKDKHGVFIDGGVSPYNNPALMLLMLASIKAYGFQWSLGAGNLLLVSVGTGSYRMRLNPGFWTRRISKLFAARALQGMINDADVLTLTLLQWLSAPRRRWQINSELKDMTGELLSFPDQSGAGNPLISFVRYDARMEKDWLTSNCAELNSELTPEYIEGLQQLDRPDLMDSMYKVGEILRQSAGHAR